MLELPSKCFPVPIEVLVQVLQLLLCLCLDFPDVQASFAFCPTKFVLMGGGSKSGPGHSLSHSSKRTFCDPINFPSKIFGSVCSSY